MHIFERSRQEHKVCTSIHDNKATEIHGYVSKTLLSIMEIQKSLVLLRAEFFMHPCQVYYLTWIRRLGVWWL